MIRCLLIVLAVIASPLAIGTTTTLDAGKLKLVSANVVVVDPADGQVVYAKAANEVTPIASLTKLMTAMVVLDAALPCMTI